MLLVIFGVWGTRKLCRLYELVGNSELLEGADRQT